MSDPIKSRPMFHSTACERCAFQRGNHASWCETGKRESEAMVLALCGEIGKMPQDKSACERCVFGSGQHAEWCESQEVMESRAIRAAFLRHPKVMRFARSGGRLYGSWDEKSDPIV